jgi:methylated-DNA-[protein]-cysteine S-methyltransferase
MMARETDEERAERRLVHRAFERLTGRDGTLLQYALMDDTPVGILGLAAGPAGLRRLEYVEGEDDFLRRLLDEFPDRPLERSAALDAVRRELDRYFQGRRFTFDTRVDLSDVTPFQQRVLRETAKVPAGKVTTYTEVATRAGRPHAARAAGNALHDNPVAIIVPCHRVLRGDGSLGGYAGGLPAKEWLLKHEGALPL